MQFLEKDASERPDFKADLVIDNEVHTVKRVNSVSTSMRRVFGEIPIVSISIALVVGAFIGMTAF